MHKQVTVDLIALIASTFKEWSIYKPATSRPCNSERYFIGMDYRGKSPHVITMLKKLATLTEDELETFKGFLNPSVSAKFKTAFDRHNQYILERQKESLIEVLTAYKSMTLEEYYNKSLNLVKYSVDWCMRFKIPYNKQTQISK